MAAPLEVRWYRGLVEPVRSSVDSALRQMEPPSDPWSVPRTGLGGAVAIHVARGFGIRRWRKASRASVIALEAYNQLVHRGAPSQAQRSRWLARDVAWLQRVWRALLEQDGPLVSRVLERLLGGSSTLGDARIPEGVLFLRAAVAAGVVEGDVADRVHGALDRYVTWLGLCWEAEQGTLDEHAWHGALDAVGLAADFLDLQSAGQRARQEARHALERLPNRPPVALFEAVLSRATRETPMKRHPQVWSPQQSPEPNPTNPVGLSAPGALGAFAAQWQGPVEEALEALAHSDSEAISSAVGYLRGQGGKRVRPLMVLAAAQACGGDPRRALPVAAAVEWIHQGSLILDDIIDEATLRRGGVALHVATSTPFAVGVAAFLFVRVHGLIQGAHPQIRRHLADAAVALADGERLELRHTGNAELTMTRYYQIIEAKTARLFAGAAAVGGVCAEASRRHVNALSRFGREAGLAFQIVDDVLDYGGQVTALGKAPGVDWRARKLTLPLLLLRGALKADERATLDEALGQPDELDWVCERLEAHDVLTQCHQRAAEHLSRARRALRSLPEGPERDRLDALATYCVERRR